MLTDLEQIQEARKGKTLVFTNGVFDILHVGHVELLETAALFGSLLIVGLNSDSSARRLGKGPERPINTWTERARLVGALRCVDGVLEFEEDTPAELIARLKPDVHVKGGDYRAEDLPETPAVLAGGGRVEIVPLIPGRSTTRLVERLRQPG